MIGLIDTPHTPSCIVTVFDRRYGRFSYACTHCCRGWQVDSGGNIYPPPLSRIVQFRTKNWSLAEGPLDAQNPFFAGFQVAAAGQPLPSVAEHWSLPSSGEVTPAITKWPDQNDDKTSLVTLNFGSQSKWIYRLAVLGADNQPIWDDPKIHDDGSDW